jgi:hypothetical protein
MEKTITQAQAQEIIDLLREIRDRQYRGPAYPPPVDWKALLCAELCPGAGREHH